ncbi:MAG: stage III sporulation protein AF [Defluviitaleaceae bacterium]|nr:stage III sporulation protein AF [Defluviitaleaceae bacterium]
MQIISEYIRNLAVFLIFSSFITIISPGKKYEPYINMVLGIILIFIVVTPLAGIITALSGGTGDFFSDAVLQHDRAVMARQIEDAGQSQIDAILENYTQALTEQLSRIISNHNFTLQHAEFDIDIGEDFGAILSMRITINENDSAGTNLIRIDPVRITPAINARGEPTMSEIEESPRILSLKNAISDFYNLSQDNIILETSQTSY